MKTLELALAFLIFSISKTSSDIVSSSAEYNITESSESPESNIANQTVEAANIGTDGVTDTPSNVPIIISCVVAAALIIFGVAFLLITISVSRSSRSQEEPPKAPTVPKKIPKPSVPALLMLPSATGLEESIKTIESVSEKPGKRKKAKRQGKKERSSQRSKAKSPSFAQKFIV